MAQIIGRTVNTGEVEFVNADDGTVIMKLQPQAAAIADATTGTEIARINDILAVLRDLGLIAT